MDEATIRQKLSEISATLNGVSIETAKIAGLQSDLCIVKEESKDLVIKVEQLESENKGLVIKVEQFESENKGLIKKVQQLATEVVDLKLMNDEMKSEITDLKNLNKAIMERLSKVEKTLMSPQSSSEFAGRSDESVIGSISVSDCRSTQDTIAPQVNMSDDASTASGGETSAKGSAIVVKKPKAQRKRELEQLYKNFSKTMAGKKIPKKLWASCFLKMSVEQWEGSAGYMQPEQLCDFVEKNIDKLVSLESTTECRERLILTLLIICGERAVPLERLKEILNCFVKRGIIAEGDAVRFAGMHKI